MSLIYFFYLTNFFYSSNFSVTQNRAKLKSNTKSWSAIRTRCPSQKNKKNKKHTKLLSPFRNNPPDATADSSTESSWIRTVFFAEGLLTLPPIPPNPCFLRNSSSRYGGTPTFLHLQISRWEFSPNFETAPSRPVWRREQRQKKAKSKTTINRRGWAIWSNKTLQTMQSRASEKARPWCSDSKAGTPRLLPQEQADKGNGSSNGLLQPLWSPSHSPIFLWNHRPKKKWRNKKRRNSNNKTNDEIKQQQQQRQCWNENSSIFSSKKICHGIFYAKRRLYGCLFIQEVLLFFQSP